MALDGILLEKLNFAIHFQLKTSLNGLNDENALKKILDYIYVSRLIELELNSLGMARQLQINIE